MSAETEIRELIHKINDVWTTKRPEEIPAAIAGCFDESVSFHGPGFVEVGRGPDVCVNSYAEFVRQTTLHECKLSEPAVDVHGDTAVATYSWEVAYALDGKDYRDKGHDVLVLARSAGKWQAVWRAMLPEQSA